MRNLSLLARLLGGFVIVALIVLAVGFVGLRGAGSLNGNIRDIGMNHLIGVQNLLQAAEAQSQINAAESTLMEKGLDAGSVQNNSNAFDRAKKVIDDAFHVYDSLAKTTDEQNLWNQFKPVFDAWWKAHQDFASLAQAYWGSPSDEAYNAMANQLPQNNQAFAPANGLLHELVRVNIHEADLAVQQGRATGLRVELISVAGMCAGVILALLLGTFLALSIARPLGKGVAFAEIVSGGDFTQKLNITGRDEVGTLARALNSMAAKLSGVVAVIQQNALEVASSSEEISATAVSLSEGAQSQASTLEQTSASVEELAASVAQVAEHARSQASAVLNGTNSMMQVHGFIEDVSRDLSEIAALAGQSVEKAEEGARSVQQVMKGIELIAEGSEKIGGIVTVISDIADQTNLLALNASIEAARAGEHGRGFAVVAEEVSKLADRSSASTKEIGALIRKSVENVREGVEVAQGSRSAMEQIRAVSQKVKDLIAGLSESMSRQVGAVRDLSNSLSGVSEKSQSISAATEEQTTNARQVSRAMETVNELTQAAAAAAEELSGSTEQLSTMAQELQRMVAQFRIQEAIGKIPGRLGRG